MPLVALPLHIATAHTLPHALPYHIHTYLKLPTYLYPSLPLGTVPHTSLSFGTTVLTTARFVPSIPHFLIPPVSLDGALSYNTYGNLATSTAPSRTLRPFLLFLLSLAILLFAIVFNLAASRAVLRLSTYLNHLRLRPSPTSAWPPFGPSTVVNRSLVTATMAPDKYKNPPQAPPTFTGTKESIVDDAKTLCDSTRLLLDKIAADVSVDKSSFASVLVPMVGDENEAQLKSRILGFYQYVSGDAELRNASTEAEKLMDDFSIECNMREDIYALVDAAFRSQKENEPHLDSESLRLLEKERKGYIRNGLGLPKGPQRDRFKEIKKRLSQIGIQFQKTLNEENGGLWFTKEELDGVPDDVVNGLEKGTGENEGKVKLSFKYPDLFPTLKFAKNPETRKKVFIANENKVYSPRASSCLQTHGAMS